MDSMMKMAEMFTDEQKDSIIRFAGAGIHGYEDAEAQEPGKFASVEDFLGTMLIMGAKDVLDDAPTLDEHDVSDCDRKMMTAIAMAGFQTWEFMSEDERNEYGGIEEYIGDNVIFMATAFALGVE